MQPHGYKRNAGRNFVKMLAAREVPLSATQIELIIGTLLGDGCLVKTSAGWSLSLSQGLDQVDFLRWKINQIGHIFLTKEPILYEPTRTASRRSMSHPDLVPLRSLVYPSGRKAITDDLLALVTPRALAVWYMDDGSFNPHPNSRQMFLCTDSFSLEENEHLCDWFRSRWSLVVKVQSSSGGWSKKQYFRLRINRSQVPSFVDLIQPYFCPAMSYKLPV